MKKPTFVLWDWNGTLFDDLAISVECLNVLLAEHGYAQQYDTAAYKDIFGFPIESYYQRAGFDFSEHSFAELAKQYIPYLPNFALDAPLPQMHATHLSPFNKRAFARRFFRPRPPIF